MSKTKPKRKGSQKSGRPVEITPPVKVDSEPCQNQELSQNLKQNQTETIDEDTHLATQTSNIEVENVNQISDSINSEELLEVPIDKHLQVQTETESERFITTVDNSTADQHIENLSSPQQPLSLEMIYSQLVFLQNGIEKLQASIDFLREEVNDLKQQKLTTDSMQVLADSRIIQANYHQQKLGNKQSRGRKFDFNAVTYLQEHGEDKLQEELVDKDNTELTKIIRSEGIKTGKDLKTFEREDIIQEIILNAKRRLKQGPVFLKD